jgi:hypothetical protein
MVNRCALGTFLKIGEEQTVLLHRAVYTGNEKGTADDDHAL